MRSIIQLSWTSPYPKIVNSNSTTSQMRLSTAAKMKLDKITILTREKRAAAAPKHHIGVEEGSSRDLGQACIGAGEPAPEDGEGPSRRCSALFPATAPRSGRRGACRRRLTHERGGGLTVSIAPRPRRGEAASMPAKAEQASRRRLASAMSAPPAGGADQNRCGSRPSGPARDADPRSCGGARMEATEAGRR